MELVLTLVDHWLDD
nr:hypothetical protein [uncultured Trichococcus sp.]